MKPPFINHYNRLQDYEYTEAMCRTTKALDNPAMRTYVERWNIKEWLPRMVHGYGAIVHFEDKFSGYTCHLCNQPIEVDTSHGRIALQHNGCAWSGEMVLFGNDPQKAIANYKFPVLPQKEKEAIELDGWSECWNGFSSMAFHNNTTHQDVIFRKPFFMFNARFEAGVIWDTLRRVKAQKDGTADYEIQPASNGQWRGYQYTATLFIKGRKYPDATYIAPSPHHIKTVGMLAGQANRSAKAIGRYYYQRINDCWVNLPK